MKWREDDGMVRDSPPPHNPPLGIYPGYNCLLLCTSCYQAIKNDEMVCHLAEKRIYVLVTFTPWAIHLMTITFFWLSLYGPML